ncbi:hypothetical protein BAE44_0006122 [Dichanthelium oligosanthes]|uniref:Uncharacterized protein n=1 Tax=Dichanthelium oligosanthes TaxID=888268 RepID=A0A1E5W664_9POAL|nr:hypothetical protein BAE44_0006122 [Dichanthelium oligosanthes]
MAHGTKIFAMQTPRVESPGAPVLDTETLDVLGDPDDDQSWSWTRVDEPAPFVSNRVRCYAPHPDGRTVLVSVQAWRTTTVETPPCYRDWSSTFASDTDILRGKYMGEWLLPFQVRAVRDPCWAADTMGRGPQ